MVMVTCVQASLTTADGVRLDADVYTPEGDGPFPVLLMRQPYGRAIASTVVYAHPRWYAAQGYIVVIQDVRGRGSSTGEFRLFAAEVEDGQATVQWAAQLPKSNGLVGMYGFSYQGMTQLYAAVNRPPALKALAPGMVGYDLYADWAYENGALCLQAGLGWAFQLAAETARRQGDETAYQRIYGAARNLPLGDRTPARPQILQDLAPDSFFHDWLDRPQGDAYWQGLRPDLTEVNLPMLHIGGWFDPYLRGTIRLFKQMQATCDRQSLPPWTQPLWIGPWVHLPWGRRVGAQDYGPEANSPIDQLQIRWFDHWLKGQPAADLAASPIHLFEMGQNRWRSLDHWPTTPDQTHYLHSQGLANLRDDDGSLTPTPPQTSRVSTLVHDPWRPVPALGGHAAVPGGSFERSAVDCRTDVATYTSPPLTHPLVVAGEIVVEIYCSADAPSFDLCAIVSRVEPGGTVYNLTQGYCRVDSTAPTTSDPTPSLQADGLNAPQPMHRVKLTLQPTCFSLDVGQALRLSLSGACFPAYAVNPGTGESAAHSTLLAAQVITLNLCTGGSMASRLLLPLAEG